MFFISSVQAQHIKDVIANNGNPENSQLNTRVASANHLARRVAYELDASYIPTEEVREIDVYDEDGEIRTYSIEMISTQHLGVVSYILTPVDKDNIRLHLVFRGSKDSPAWCRTTETPAPGCESFYADRSIILKTVCDTLEQMAKHRKIHLVISGHSLGGSDAQNCATEIMEAIAELDKNNIFFNEFKGLKFINKISINHANSAGVSKEVASKSKVYACYLAEKLGIEINLMCVFMAGDGVQQTGQDHILADIEQNIARVELVKLNSEYEGVLNKKAAAVVLLTLPVTTVFAAGYSMLAAYCAYKAHKLRFFDHEQFKQQAYVSLDNTTQEGSVLIQNKLSRHPLDNVVLKSSLLVVNYIQTYFTETKRHNLAAFKGYVLIEEQDAADTPTDESQLLVNPKRNRSACSIQ